MEIGEAAYAALRCRRSATEHCVEVACRPCPRAIEVARVDAELGRLAERDN